MYFCSSSSRCARVLVWWECSSVVTGRAQQRHRAGVGSQRSWGPADSWICAGCFLLLALLSTARQEPPLFKMINIKKITMQLTLIISFSFCRTTIKDETPTVQIMQAVAGLVVSLHRCIRGGHFAGWDEIRLRFYPEPVSWSFSAWVCIFSCNHLSLKERLICNSKWAVGMTQTVSVCILWWTSDLTHKMLRFGCDDNDLP